MLDDRRRQAARLADFPVSGVVFKLKREQFQRERIKILAAANVRRLQHFWNSEFGVRN